MLASTAGALVAFEGLTSQLVMLAMIAGVSLVLFLPDALIRQALVGYGIVVCTIATIFLLSDY